MSFPPAEKHLKGSSMISKRAKVPKKVTYLVDVPYMDEFHKEFIRDFMKELNLADVQGYELHSVNEDDGSIVYKIKVPFWNAKMLLENLRSLFTRKWEWDDFDWIIKKAGVTRTAGVYETPINLVPIQNALAKLQQQYVQKRLAPKALQEYIDQEIDASDFSEDFKLRMWRVPAEFLGEVRKYVLSHLKDLSKAPFYKEAFNQLVLDLLENLEDWLKGLGLSDHFVQEALDEAANDPETLESAVLPATNDFLPRSYIEQAYGVPFRDLVNQDKQEAFREDFLYTLDDEIETLISDYIQKQTGERLYS